MVLSGKINSEVVALINAHGGKAVGLSGKDADLFTAKRIRSKENMDLGFVGDITDVDTKLLNTLSSTGYIPVLSSVGRSKEGETLNMNADHVAQRIAEALSCLKLIYLTDVKGLIIDNQLQTRISIETSKEYLLSLIHI